MKFLNQVRNADSSWRDVRKQLRKDQRWDLAESLDREEKEKLFDEHMDELSKKNKEMFHKLLEETSGVSATYTCISSICFEIVQFYFHMWELFCKSSNFMLQITLTSTWKEVKKMIKEDPRYSKFSSSDRVSK